MSTCVFCRIAAGELPAKIVHDEPEVFAISDINPQAPVHLLIVPRAHIPALSEAEPAQAGLLGKLLLVARDLAKKYKLDKGFRVVMNNGRQAGQSVDHVHFHVLGGRSMNWPPG